MVRSDELQKVVDAGRSGEYTIEVWDCSEMESDLLEEVDLFVPAHRRSVEYGLHVSERFGGYV